MKSCGNTDSLGTLRISRLVFTQCLAAALWRFRSRPRKPRTPDVPATPAAHNKFARPRISIKRRPKARNSQSARNAARGARPTAPAPPAAAARDCAFFGRRGLPPTAKIFYPSGVDCCKSAGSPGRHAQSAELQRGGGGNQPQRAPERTAEDESTTARGTEARRPTKGERERRDNDGRTNRCPPLCCLRRQAGRTAAHRKRKATLTERTIRL